MKDKIKLSADISEDTASDLQIAYWQLSESAKKINNLISNTMDPKELRIGNFYTTGVEHYLSEFDDKVECLESLVKDNKWTGGYCLISTNGNKTAIDRIQPILLTKEILLKCGFKKVSRNNGLFYTHNDCFELHEFNQWEHFSYTCGDNLSGNFISTRVDSLHQLQNLYFLVNGKELEVKL